MRGKYHNSGKSKVITAGIDVGSRTIKVVLLKDRNIMAKAISDTGIEHEATALNLFEKCCQTAGILRSTISKIVTTGYGRELVSHIGKVATEITCHALGVRHFIKNVRSIIEIGGQDSKFIRLDEKGRVRDFALNDRCAAGTGRFLEVIGGILKIPIEEMGRVARNTSKPATISSTCTVFAESEILGLLAKGVKREEVLAGAQRAMAARILMMAGRRIEEPLVFTGGVALNKGMVLALEAEAKTAIQVPPLPQFTGAIGAALLAARL